MFKIMIQKWHCNKKVHYFSMTPIIKPQPQYLQHRPLSFIFLKCLPLSFFSFLKGYWLGRMLVLYWTLWVESIHFFNRMFRWSLSTCTLWLRFNGSMSSGIRHFSSICIGISMNNAQELTNYKCEFKPDTNRISTDCVCIEIWTWISRKNDGGY